MNKGKGVTLGLSTVCTIHQKLIHSTKNKSMQPNEWQRVHTQMHATYWTQSSSALRSAAKTNWKQTSCACDSCGHLHASAVIIRYRHIKVLSAKRTM